MLRSLVHRGPLAVTLILTAHASSLFGAVPSLSPGSSPLSIAVSAGSVEINGHEVEISPTQLTIAPPFSEEKTITTVAPVDYTPNMDNWSWPRQGKKPGAITFSDTKDENGVLILGMPYKQYPLDKIVVSSVDGSKTFIEGKDYKVQPDYGQIVNLNGGLGTPQESEVKVSYVEVQQRLDLIQVSAAGKVSVKQGNSRFVCPYLPEVDPGSVALAGVYVAPWMDTDSPVPSNFIFPVAPKAPVAPINPEAVAKTLAKLENGEEVTIAFMGDSLTLGAEAGKWWEDDTQHWRGRFLATLRSRFPEANIKELKAFKGGQGTAYGLEQLNETVLPNNPDLLVLMMGINDADSSISGIPKVSPAEYGTHMEDIIKKAQEAGIEVILMTSMEPYPFKANGHAQRWPEYVSIQYDLAKQYNVGLADTYQEWMNLDYLGIPHYSQMHNWNNHPGSFGHGVIADVPLRFFPAQ